MKHNQPCPGFELGSLIPFPMTIIIMISMNFELGSLIPFPMTIIIMISMNFELGSLIPFPMTIIIMISMNNLIKVIHAYHNDYCHRKWNQRTKFKSWTRLVVFHFVLIPLEKAWIYLFFLQLWVNSRPDWVLYPWLCN